MMKKYLLGAAVTTVACTLAANAAVILIDSTTNDGSFESTSVRVADPTSTGNVYAKTTSTPAGWTMINGDANNNNFMETNRTPWGYSDNTGNLNLDYGAGPLGVGLQVASAGSTASFISPSLLGTGGYGTTTAASEGDELSWSIDLLGDLTYNVYLNAVNVGFGSLSTAAYGAVANTYTLTAADALAINAGALAMTFEITNAGAAPRGDNVIVSVATAVPEPATLGLLGLAFGGLVMLRRRRK